MRTLVALAVALFVGGCGDDTSKTQMDMAMNIPDLAVGSDMAKLQSCMAILSCASACGTDVACAAACPGKATTTAQGYFLPLAGCVLNTCGPGDGGNHSCSGPTDTSMTCTTCLGNVGAGSALAGNPCHAEFANCASH
jgi:hypothetical protein